MTILVFPSCLEASVSFAKEARGWHQRVVGASSLDADPYASQYDAWEKLPFVGEGGFFRALHALIERQNVDSIFTPHAVSFNVLAAELPRRLPQVSLIGEGPFKTQVKHMEEALKQAERDRVTIADFGIAAVAPPAQLVAGLALQMERIYGQCSRQKTLAVCAVMPSAVKGDVVEIGSMFGKSTYLFNRLASHLRVGGTLAIDPWDEKLSIQQEVPPNVRDAPRNWDWEVMHQGFLINMLGCANPPFNYMRTTSADAFVRYCTKPEVESAEFGRTTFAGSISVLHIDGNHDESVVDQDFSSWSTRLAPGAWVVFDDYNWSHANGPRKVADRAVKRLGGRISKHFVAGAALFVKIDG